MNPGPLRVRRATLDDLPALRPLWNSMRFDVPDMERRLTEYQVAVDGAENVVGGIGFQIVQRHAVLRGEAFPDFSLAETVRPMFWERMQSLALNHGIARLWTREDAPFWKQNGFQPASAEVLKRLPAEIGSSSTPWLTLSLKDEDSIVSLEKELALFMQAEKQRTARALNKAKTVKTIATVIALIFGLLVLAAMIFLLRRNAAAG
ncbi:MAG TPA: hypothetical protein VEH04_10775 [Verrucomicrobiae bacterium]|nr:hypothetical protein [Verrucomicrobiae bacterium]